MYHDKLANYLENKIWYMLLFTVAVIPLEQEFTSFCVAMTFIGAVIVAHVKGLPQQENVLKPWQQGAFYLLLLISVGSVYFPWTDFVLLESYLCCRPVCGTVFVLLRYGRSSEQDRAHLTACEAEPLTQSEAWKMLTSSKGLRLCGSASALCRVLCSSSVLFRCIAVGERHRYCAEDFRRYGRGHLGGPGAVP